MIATLSELRGVSKAFGESHTRVQALTDVSLSIHAGELTLIEGPSGSGKTTLLHILGLLQRADRGEVWIGGRRLDAFPESRLSIERRRNVVLIFQGANLLESLTVHDNVAIAQHVANGRRRHASVTEHLQRVGMDGRAGHLPRQLSGGEKQRTAIARALACPGHLILADEPTANLDWASAQQVVARLVELAHRDGRAVVMVTHDSRVEAFADRIIKLEDGRVRGDERRRDAPMATAGNLTDTVPNGDTEHRRRWPLAVVLGAAIVLIAATWFAVFGRDSGTSTPPPASSETQDSATFVAAAPAVVEPVTHLVKLQTERPGRIKTITKHAGDRIAKGETLVTLDDALPAAAVAQRQAEVALAEANLAELIAWHRPEERQRRKAALEYAQVHLDRAARELQRVESLFGGGSASKTERDRAVEDHRLATAALEEARQASQIAEAGPTLQERAVAEARVAQAKAALQLAERDLSYYTIVSPLEGHVIYRHLEPGEVVDPESPLAILSIGNLDHVRLRAEVDEADIRRVGVGQEVVATAEAFADRPFKGRVVHLEPIMGRTSIRTERTTEQKDTKVREVLIELDPKTPRLPIDLQMTVRFLAGERPNDKSGD